MEINAAQSLRPSSDLKLLPHRIEYYAKYQPAMLYTLRSSRNPDLSIHLEPVSYAIFAHAINRAAWWLDDHLCSTVTQVFTYHGPQDIRWTILSVAAIKTGRTVSKPHIYLYLTYIHGRRCSACHNGLCLTVLTIW